MNIKNFLIRSLMLLTVIVGTIFISIVEDQTTVTSMLSLFMFFIILCWLCYYNIHNLTKEEINNLLGITWLENKTGLNFLEE